jgi:autotransporter-associated beta strand protein
MNYKTLFLCVCVAASVVQAQTVLTYNGANDGDWFAANVWLDAASQPASWQDGAVAVITNRYVNLTTNATVYGLRVHLAAYTRFHGAGKMTIGAGGIVKTGSGEMNIRYQGGVHLTASQPWDAPDGGLICPDGLVKITAEDGVTITGGGRAVLRMNSGGALGASQMLHVKTNAHISMPASGSLGSPVVLLEGDGVRLSADANCMLNATRFGSRLIVRDGADLNGAACTLSLPKIEVDAPSFTTQVVSLATFTSLALGVAETELAVTAPAMLQMNAPLNDATDVSAALRKTGSGVLRLSRAGQFSGGLTVDNGWTELAHAAGAGTGPVTLAAGTTLELTGDGTVPNVISGDGCVVKSGATSVTLGGANTYAGGTSIAGGAVRVATPAGLGSGAVTVAEGAKLVLTASQTVVPAEVARIAGDGSVWAGAGAEVVWGADYMTGSTPALLAESGGIIEIGQLTGSGFVKTQPGTLRINGTTGYSGEIVVNEGVLDIGSTANLAAGVTVRTEGSGCVQLNGLAGQDLTRITGTRTVAFADGASVAVDTDTLTVGLSTVANQSWTAAPLSGSGDLVKTGPGTLVVANGTAFTGNVRVLQGELVATDALGSGSVTVSNGVFAARGADASLLNTFTVAGGELLADAGASLGAGTIQMLAGGVVAATNGGSLGSGSLALSAGRLRMDAGGSAGTRAVTLSNSGRIEVYDGAGFDQGASLTIGGGTLEFRATTTLNIGVTLTANTTFSANTSAGAQEAVTGTLAGFLTTTARSKVIVNGNARLRIAGGGSFISGGEIFVQSDGDLEIVSNKVTVTGYAGLESSGKRFAVADGGTFEMSNSGARLHAGHGSGNALFEVLTGGVFTAKSVVHVAMNGGDCTFRVNGGEAILEGNVGFECGNGSAASDGRIELLAGILRTSRQLTRGTGTGQVVFNGGTWVRDAAFAPNPWIASTIPLTVEAGGGQFVLNGAEGVLGSAGLSGTGILQLTGGGALTFGAASPDWTGGLTLVDADAAAAATNALGYGDVLLGTNTLRVSADVLLPNHVYAPLEGGCISVDEGVCGAVAELSGGYLTKRGAGELVADNIKEGSDLSIQAGTVKVEPIAAVAKVPAGEPVIWMDASVAASCTMATSNEVSRWYDRRTPGSDDNFYASVKYKPPLWVTNALNGLPVLDFGKLGQSGQVNENRMLEFKSYQDNIRSVFWVIGSRNGGGFLLGDSKNDSERRHFHRGSQSGSFGGVPGDSLWHAASDKGVVRAGETWTNGIPVNGMSCGLSGGYDLVSWRLSEADDAAGNAPGAIWFASCYAPTDGRLNGGQELGEVLIYTNRLSEAERLATERYLMRKWFSQHTSAGLALGTVSLDGAGAGFVNAYPAPVRIVELVVNAEDVFVTGVPGSTIAERVTVTASGVLDAARLTALAAAELVMQEQATLAASLDANGQAVALHVEGDVSLPVAARYTVGLGDGVRPASRTLLVTADGAIVTPGAATTWTRTGGQSGASRVVVDPATSTIWLYSPQGTVMFLR